MAEGTGLKRERTPEFEDGDDDKRSGTEDISGHDDRPSDSEWLPASKIKSAKAKHKRKTGLYASVESLATDETKDDVDLQEKLANVDSTILDRIRKALALAQHAGTGEHEARQALRLSTRLLSQANLTQADVIAQETEKERQQRAGSSQVAIRHYEEKRINMESWSSSLAGAVKIFFDVQCYTETRRQNDPRIVWVFYGLSANTVAAALAFEMVYNQALHWAKANKDAKGKTGKNSYLHGLADGLYAMAKQEKKKEEKLAIEAETNKQKAAVRDDEEQRRKETARLQDPLPSMKRKGSGTKEDAIEVLSDDGSRSPTEPKWDLFPADSSNTKATKVEDVDDEDEVKFVGLKVGRSGGPPDPNFVIKMEGVQGHTYEEEPITGPLGDDDSETEYETGSEGGFEDFGGGFGTMNDPAHFEDGDDFDVDMEADRLLNGASDVKEEKTAGFSNRVKKEEILDDAEDIKPTSDYPTSTFMDIYSTSSLPQGPSSSIPVKQEPKVDEEEENYGSWQSMGQLTLFRNNAQQIADDYLKSTKLKLRKGRAFKGYRRDKDAYGQGKEDAKKVDFRRRRIEG